MIFIRIPTIQVFGYSDDVTTYCRVSRNSRLRSCYQCISSIGSSVGRSIHCDGAVISRSIGNITSSITGIAIYFKTGFRNSIIAAIGAKIAQQTFVGYRSLVCSSNSCRVLRKVPCLGRHTIRCGGSVICPHGCCCK